MSGVIGGKGKVFLLFFGGWKGGWTSEGNNQVREWGEKNRWCLSFHTVEINLTSELWNKKGEAARLGSDTRTHNNATLQDEHKELHEWHKATDNYARFSHQC